MGQQVLVRAEPEATRHQEIKAFHRSPLSFSFALPMPRPTRIPHHTTGTFRTLFRAMFVARSSMLCVVAAVLACVSQAFILPAAAPVSAPSVRRQSRSRVAPLQMGLFDSIKKGFENEAQGQPAPNAGLKNVCTE